MNVVDLDKVGFNKGLNIEVRQEVKNVLHIVNYLIVDRKFTLDDSIHVCMHLLKARLEALEALHLVRHSGSERTDRGVIDIAEQVLHTDLLGLIRFNEGVNVLKGAYSFFLIIDLLNRVVCLSRHALNFGANVHDYEHRVRAVTAEKSIEVKIVLANFGSRRVKSNDALRRIDLAEHVKHVLKEAVIEVPDTRVLHVLFKRYSKGV
mmetsp:Transcript_21780/g.42871  ORF Transcript_21780/g.42871 Transcript_21780/m.42871 type:complete len:206 (-) Transcript_21780:474-1091(-)